MAIIVSNGKGSIEILRHGSNVPTSFGFVLPLADGKRGNFFQNFARVNWSELFLGIAVARDIDGDRSQFAAERRVAGWVPSEREILA